MKFKIGDQVTVISVGVGSGWAEPMNQYLHKTGTIIADYTTDPLDLVDPTDLGFLDDAWNEKRVRYRVEFKRDGWSTYDRWWFPEDSLELSNQKRHKQADLIHAWVEGAEIEYKDPETGLWFDWDSDAWNDELECRIKPNWWENIPAHGVLVKSKSSGVIFVIKQIIVDGAHNWEPLTNQEIERFKR